MDDRVIPFGFPELPGGAQGGASIDPTPPSSDPEQIYYNLDDFKATIPEIVANSTKVGNVYLANTTTADWITLSKLKLSGIVPVDLTGVKQIAILAEYADLVITADGTDIKSDTILKNNTAPTSETVFDSNSSVIAFQDDGTPNMKDDVYNYALAFTKAKWNTYTNMQIVVEWPCEIVLYDVGGDELASYDKVIAL